MPLVSRSSQQLHTRTLSALCSPSLTLLFSNKTLSRRRSLFILPSFQTTGEGHQGFTTDSHFGEKNFFPSDAAFSLVWSALLFLSYRRDKSVKDKDKYKDKTVKEAPSCFPPVQIVLQVSHWDDHQITNNQQHQHIYPLFSLMNRRPLFADEPMSSHLEQQPNDKQR